MVRKSLPALLVSLLLASTLLAGHYDMGPARRFAPEPTAEARTIGLSSGWTFDTRLGEPDLPANLRLDQADPAAVVWIVQFEGPVERSWVRKLQGIGLDPLGYLPHNAVLCRLDATRRAEVEALPFVTWTGVFQPAYKLEPGLEAAAGETRFAVLLAPHAPEQPVLDLVSAFDGSVQSVTNSGPAAVIELTLEADAIPALARLPEVLWVQAWSAPEFANDDAQWVVQSGWRSSVPPDSTGRSAWHHGVRGRRAVLSVTDTGLNTGHDMFRDPSLSITPPGIWPEHRKVVAFKLMAGPSGTADPGESQYHGSHVNGTVAGDDSITGGSSGYDGMARDARLYFVDLTTSSGTFVIGTDFTALWDTVYAGRGLPDSLRPVKQHSGSWRWYNSSGTYLIQDATTDAFNWANKDFTNIMAAGNEYSARRIGNPAIAKNVLTIGATQNGTSSNAIASFSSRGPTEDNRIKPNVMAPGVDLYSAQRTGTSGYSAMSGTSMATPAANGTVGLLRSYLTEGYYPTGTPEPGNRVDYVSSALLRSMAIVSADPNVGSYTIPSFDIGWGRIDADSVLFFPGESRRLIILDDTTGLATGEFKELQFRVNSSIPLKVCLAWTDTAAAPNANPTLVNDLNLELIAPGGTEYRGNQYTSGQSQPNPGTWDNRNVEECVRVNAPDTGLWRIWVGAQQVATAANQPFAWTITGDVELTALAHDVGSSALIAPAGQVDSGVVVVPAAIIANLGTGPETFDVEFTISAVYVDTQEITLQAGASDTLEFAAWNAGPVGWFEARVKTLLAGDENPANDILADSFQVLPTTGIEGGGALPRRFELGAAQPTPFRGRTTLRLAVPYSTSAEVGVYAIDGTLVRTLASGQLRPGWHSLTWDGTDNAGAKVGRGIYYCRALAPGFSGVRKLVLTQ